MAVIIHWFICQVNVTIRGKATAWKQSKSPTQVMETHDLNHRHCLPALHQQEAGAGAEDSIKPKDFDMEYRCLNHLTKYPPLSYLFLFECFIN